MAKFWIVARETYRKNVKSWAFLLMVLGPFLMMAISVGVGYFIGNERVQNTGGHIAVVSQDDQLNQTLATQSTSLQLDFMPNVDEARLALEQDKVEGYLVIAAPQGQLTATYYQKNTGKSLELGQLNDILSNYQAQQIGNSLKLSSEQIQSIRAITVDVERVKLVEAANGTLKEEANESINSAIQLGLAFAVVFVSYILIMTHASILATEVATEKGGRIMEIILSSMPANLHLLGKLCGSILVMLTQLAVYIVVAIAGYLMIDMADFLSVLAPYKLLVLENLPSVGIALLFAVTGTIAFLLIAAILGAAVSRTDDVQKVIQPVVMLAIIGLYIGLYGVEQPNSFIVQIGSWLPVTTPFVMPVRLASGVVSGVELWLVLGGLVLFMILMLGIALTFYKATALSTSDKGAIHTFKRAYTLWKSERENIG